MKKRSIFFEIIDAMFIMILCFGTLLTAMLMKGANINLSYTVHMNTLLVVIIGLVICMTFILNHSEKGLKKIIEHLY